MSTIREYVEAVFMGRGSTALALRVAHPELEEEMDAAVWQRLQHREEQGYGIDQTETTK